MVRIRTVEALPGHRLRLGLTDGRTIERDLSGRLFGPVFAANGADLDPDMLIWGGVPPEAADDSPAVRPGDADAAGSPVQPNR